MGFAKSIPMLAALMRFEFRLWFRDYPFYITTLLFFCYWFYFSIHFDYDPNFWGANSEVFYNAPVVAYFLFSSQSFVNFFITPLFSATPALRDFDHHAWPYLHSLPVDRRLRFWTRYCSGFLVNLLSILLASSAILIAPILVTPTGFPVAPQTMSMPLTQVCCAWLVLVLPNIFFGSAIVYALSIRYRSLPPALAGTFILVLGSVTSRYFGSSIDNFALLVSDATAFHIVHQIAEYWTIEQRNSAFLPFTQALLINRLFWISVGMVTLHFAYRWDTLAKKRLYSSPQKSSIRISWISFRPILDSIRFNVLRPNHPISPLFHQCSWELKHLVKDPFFAMILGLSLAWIFLQDLHITRQNYDLVLPITPLMLKAKRGLWMLTFLFIPFVASTAIFRERSVQMDQIAGSLPPSSASILLGKFTAVSVYCLSFPTFVFVAGVTTQWIHAYHRWDFPLYFFDLYGRYYLFLLRNIALAFFFAGLFSTRLKGYAGTIAVFYVFVFAQETGVWKHEFLAPSYLQKNSSSVFWSIASHVELDSARFGFWTSLIILLLVLSHLTWIRGPQLCWKNRIRSAYLRFRLNVAILTILAALGLVISVFAYDEAASPRQGPSRETASTKVLAIQKQQLEPSGLFVHPKLRHFDLDLDFDDKKNLIRCIFKGTFENLSKQSVEHLFVQLPEQARLAEIKFGLTDPLPISFNKSSSSFHVFNLDLNSIFPSQQVQTMTLEYSLPWFRPAFSGKAPAIFLDEPSLLPNFRRSEKKQSSLHSLHSASTISKQSFLQNGNELATRIEFTPRRIPLPPNYGVNPLTWNIDVSSPTDRYVWAPGSDENLPLKRGQNRENQFDKDRTKNERTRLRFYSSVPDRSRFLVGIANYLHANDIWTPSRGETVHIEIFADPNHQQNVDQILHGAKSALSKLTSIFGSYPYRTVRIVETPHPSAMPPSFEAGSHLGFANLVVIPESELWTADYRHGQDRDRIDYFMGQQLAAHWWHNRFHAQGHHPGQQVLQSGLPNYYATRLVEENYSSKLYLKKYHTRRLHSYFWNHGIHGHQEPNLLNVADNRYIGESKATFAFRILAKHLGTPTLDTILRNFLHQNRILDEQSIRSDDDSPNIKRTSLASANIDHLYQDIIDQTPLPTRAIVEEIFLDRVTYQVRLRRAEANRISDSENQSKKSEYSDAKYLVRLELEIQRLRPSHGGSTISLPWRGEIDISLSLRNHETHKSILWPYSANVRNGVQTIAITVPYLPETASLDPGGYLIDPNRSDQLRSIKLVD